MSSIAIDTTLTPFDSSRYFGKAARYVEEEREKVFNHLQGSDTLGLAATFRQLDETFKECSLEGWDGERAKPITEEVLRNAKNFLKSFPLGIEPPEVGAEPDGAISLEWYQSSDRVISISINPGKWLYYAAIIGSARRRHGRDPVLSGVSDDLLKLIRRVASKVA